MNEIDTNAGNDPAIQEDSFLEGCPFCKYNRTASPIDNDCLHHAAIRLY